MPIKDYSTTAANNTLTPPNGAPEGMAAGLVNNTMRQLMADTRSFYESGGWCDLGHVPTYVSATSFTIPTDVTAFYGVGRRIRMYGAIMGTFYGYVASSAYSSPNTTVTVVLDSGTLTSNLSRVEINFLDQFAMNIRDGAVTNTKLADGSVTPSKLSTNGPYWDSSGSVGIGTTSPSAKLDVRGFSEFGRYGGVSQGVRIGNNNDSAISQTSSFIDFSNNLSTVDSSFISVHQTNGGSRFEFYTTPSGSRSMDRRVLRMAITDDGSKRSAIPVVSTLLYPEYACRAWVNFNGTGTVTIRSSGNVSSVTDFGTGSYGINLSEAMPDINYSISLSVGRGTGDLLSNCINVTDGTVTTSAFSVVLRSTNATLEDKGLVYAAIFR